MLRIPIFWKLLNSPVFSCISLERFLGVTEVRFSGEDEVDMLESSDLHSSKFLNRELGGFKKALRPFSAELPKSDSDACLGRFDSDLGVHLAATLTFGLYM